MEKKSKAIPVLLGIFIIVGVFWYSLFSRSLNPALNHQNQSDVAKLTQVFLGPRPPIYPIPKKETVDSNCLNLWQSLRQIDLKKLRFPLEVDRVPGALQCKKYPGVLSASFSGYQERCGPFSDKIPKFSSKEEWEKEFYDCYSSLATFRAVITHWLNKDKKLSEISDSGVLSDLLFANGLHPDGSIHFDEGGETPIVERMLELNPQSLELRKYLVNSEMGDFFRNKESDREKADVALGRVGELLKDSERTNPENPDLPEMKLFVATGGFDRDRLEEAADEMASKNHPSGLGYYFLASLASMDGRKEDAEGFLQQALELEPKKKRYLEAWEQFQKSGEVMASINWRLTSSYNIIMGHDSW